MKYNDLVLTTFGRHFFVLEIVSGSLREFVAEEYIRGFVRGMSSGLLLGGLCPWRLDPGGLYPPPLYANIIITGMDIKVNMCL